MKNKVIEGISKICRVVGNHPFRWLIIVLIIFFSVLYFQGKKIGNTQKQIAESNLQFLITQYTDYFNSNIDSLFVGLRTMSNAYVFQNLILNNRTLESEKSQLTKELRKSIQQLDLALLIVKFSDDNIQNTQISEVFQINNPIYSQSCGYQNYETFHRKKMEKLFSELRKQIYFDQGYDGYGVHQRLNNHLWALSDLLTFDNCVAEKSETLYFIILTPVANSRSLYLASFKRIDGIESETNKIIDQNPSNRSIVLLDKNFFKFIGDKNYFNYSPNDIFSLIKDSQQDQGSFYSNKNFPIARPGSADTKDSDFLFPDAERFSEKNFEDKKTFIVWSKAYHNPNWKLAILIDRDQMPSDLALNADSAFWPSILFFLFFFFIWRSALYVEFNDNLKNLEKRLRI